jgi:hypothetical protein
MTFRVEVTRDETLMAGGVAIEITAYIDRVPEYPEIGHRRLERAPKGVWNSRLLFGGDFPELSEALDAIEAGFPDVVEIRCSEHSIDYEFPYEMPPLVKTDGEWRPGKRREPGPPPLLDWRVGRA